MHFLFFVLICDQITIFVNSININRKVFNDLIIFLSTHKTQTKSNLYSLNKKKRRRRIVVTLDKKGRNSVALQN